MTPMPKVVLSEDEVLACLEKEFGIKGHVASKMVVNNTDGEIILEMEKLGG